MPTKGFTPYVDLRNFMSCPCGDKAGDNTDGYVGTWTNDIADGSRATLSGDFISCPNNLVATPTLGAAATDTRCTGMQPFSIEDNYLRGVGL